MQATQSNAGTACASPALAARPCRCLRPFRSGRRQGRQSMEVRAQYSDDRYISGTPEKRVSTPSLWLVDYRAVKSHGVLQG